MNFGVVNRALVLGVVASIAIVISDISNATSEVLPDFPPAVFSTPDKANVKLGQLLFFDPLLSGNRNISCATCHHPRFATSDGVSLAIGEGGIGVGPDRQIDPDNPPLQRIGRNSPALFNLGASEFTSLFHDGRLEVDLGRASGFRTPLEDEMINGFDSLLSAQAMFPVLSGDEMAGHYSQNDVSQAVRQGILTQPGGAWDIVAKRVENNLAYRKMFDEIIGPREIKFTDISNFIANFIAVEWRADNSPFDQYLRGAPLASQAIAGLELFYGKAGCSTCHSGRFQTDHDFHAIAMPQFGPGKAARFENHTRDTGRMRVTGKLNDAYKFRTPSLRNVALTAPYGHDGAFASLEAIIRHHIDPISGLKTYERTQVILPEIETTNDWTIMNSQKETEAIAAANELQPVDLSDSEIESIIVFLNSLTDKTGLHDRLGVPVSVPSGLPID